ncbi:hypothetical protein P1X14_12005 [Sphingomonas sp. AOB5]|nr:hypothetical protein [Sphingomonas sp. AOB5]MDF7775972.1 hypothetical protein [Sphingomonas sp. AOB5]
MKRDAIESGERPEWAEPQLVEDFVADATGSFFGNGIDNYEATNPVAYGS